MRDDRVTGIAPEVADVPLPPARTALRPGGASVEDEVRPVRPFVSSVAPVEPPVPGPVEAQPAWPAETRTVPETEPSAAAEPSLPTVDVRAGLPGDVPAADAGGLTDGNGVAEALEEAFPVDAFFVPEEVAHAPVGLNVGGIDTDVAPSADAAPAVGSGDPLAVARLADRLDRFAQRLRRDGYAAIGAGMARGDRLELLLSGLLAGYLAGRDD
jgi:hypothetical protein